MALDPHETSRKLEAAVEQATIQQSLQSRKLEATAEQATRPRVEGQGVLASGIRRSGQDRATFSTIQQSLEELQKRLEATSTKAQEIQSLLCGPLSDTTDPPVRTKQERTGLSVFERLGLETMVLASEIARLDKMLDRALGALR